MTDHKALADRLLAIRANCGDPACSTCETAREAAAALREPLDLDVHEREQIARIIEAARAGQLHKFSVDTVERYVARLREPSTTMRR